MSSANGKRYWCTPAGLWLQIREEFGEVYDPCPHPVPEGFDGLTAEWESPAYVNPPFTRRAALDGKHCTTAFVRKAIEEHAKGKTVALVATAQSWIGLMLDAGAELRNLGRVRFEDVETGEPSKQPSPTYLAVLRGK